MPALYIIGASVLVVVLLIYRTQTTWPGFFIVLLGVPVYYAWRRKKDTAEARGSRPEG